MWTLNDAMQYLLDSFSNYCYDYFNSAQSNFTLVKDELLYFDRCDHLFDDILVTPDYVRPSKYPKNV